MKKPSSERVHGYVMLVVMTVAACDAVSIHVSRAAAQQTTAVSTRQAALDGRWNMVFDLPENQFRTPIEFDVAPGGKVIATILGVPLIERLMRNIFVLLLKRVGCY